MGTERLLPALALTLNAAVWGLSWWPFRRLEAAGLHPLWATVLIYALAVAAITLWRPSAWGQLLRTPSLWWLVFASGATNASFNWALTLGDVVRVVLLFYLMPLWAVLLARGVLGERVSPFGVLRVALALTGAMVVLWPSDGGWPWPRSLADVLGIVGGFTFALNTVMLRREARRPKEARALAMFAGGALVAGTLAWALGDARVPGPPAPAWGWMAGALAMGAAFLASNLALQYGAARLPASVTAVVMVSEILFASVSALWLGAGQWSMALLLGGGLIVAASLLAAWRPEG